MKLQVVCMNFFAVRMECACKMSGLTLTLGTVW